MRGWPRKLIVGTVVLCGLGARPSGGETLLPLQTEEAKALSHGHAEAVLGIGYAKDQRFPLFTPEGAIESQDLLSLPRIALNVGLGDWVEIQASFEMLYLDEELDSGDADTTYGAGDARLFTKLYLLEDRNWRPAAGLHFGAKLPNASVDDRLGTDETDFLIAVLLSKELGWVSAHLNLGLALLGNPGPTAPTPQPFDSDGQDDLFTFAAAISSRPLVGPGTTAVRLLAEIAGQEGSRFDNDRAAFRGGVQIGSGAWQVYTGISAGLVAASENVGVNAGVIYAFEPGTWFE